MVIIFKFIPKILATNFKLDKTYILFFRCCFYCVSHKKLVTYIFYLKKIKENYFFNNNNHLHVSSTVKTVSKVLYISLVLLFSFWIFVKQKSEEKKKQRNEIIKKENFKIGKNWIVILFLFMEVLSFFNHRIRFNGYGV
jgi:hypothetical protein